MENRSLFISSCSRRQLARRRSARPAPWRQLLVALAILAVATATVIALGGGL